MDRNYIQSAHVINLGPFADETFTFGPSGAVILGENAKGKSSLLNILSFCLSGGSDPTLVRRGCDAGEVTLSFSDGSTFWKYQRLPDDPNEKGEVKVKVRGPQGEIRKQEAAWIGERIPKKSFSVDGFLRMDAEDQADWLVEHIDISFSADEFNALLETPVGKLKNTEAVYPPTRESVPLTRFNEARESVYASRTEINTQIRTHKTALAEAVAELAKLKPTGKDWATERDRLQRDVSEIDQQLASVEAEIKLEAERARADARQRAEEELLKHRGIVSEYVQSVERFSTYVTAHAENGGSMLSDDAAETIARDFKSFLSAVKEIAEAKAILDSYIVSITAEKIRATKEQTAALEQRRAELSLDLGSARANADNEQQMAGARSVLESRKKTAEDALKALTTREMRRTAVLDAMDAAKHLKLKQAPIDGLDIKIVKGHLVILINGTPFARLSGQEKIYLAIQCIQLGSGSMPVITVEGAELTETYLDMLIEACKTAEPPIQCFVSFREAGKELTVEAIQ